MKQLSPVAGRFTRSHVGYNHPARLAAWEQAALDLGPESMRPIWPGGSISGCDDGWDDCDE
ncbi:hypothetical protein [Lapillicoccus sp.]|uniref:hypothetical protein n=1 Tax=Lapillicoccus sp. TaxID=1909287 RepID=UPI003265AFCB